MSVEGDAIRNELRDWRIPGDPNSGVHHPAKKPFRDVFGNAADTVVEGAATATTQAGIATTAADEADADRIAAAAHRDQSETNAIAAGAKIYGSTADGRAATTSGQYFQVTTKRNLSLYRNDAGVATFIDFVTRVVFDAFTDLSDLTYNESSAGDIVEAAGHRYIVEPTTAITVGLLDYTGTGGVKLRVLRGANGYNWLAWGVKPKDPTTTPRAQLAIDFVLESGEQELLAPANHYILGQLRMFNPTGSARAQRGKMTLRGEGQLDQTELYRGETVNGFYGTIIESTETLSDAVVLASGDTKQRSGRIENLTIIYGGSGYAIDARYIPYMSMEQVSVRLTAANSNGMQTGDVWGGVLKKVYMTPDISLRSTGHGIRFKSTIFAGNWVVKDSSIDTFNINLWFDGGANFAQVILQNTWLQRSYQHAIFCQTALWHLILRDEYSESAGEKNTNGALSGTYFKVDPTNGVVNNLEVQGGFFLGGTGSSAWTTAPLFDLGNVAQAKFSGIKYYQPWAPLLHLRGNVKVEIDGIDVQHSAAANLPAGTLYMITGDVAGRRVMLNRETITPSAKLAWYDPNSVVVSKADSESITAGRAFSLGDLKQVVIGLGSVYDMGNANPRPLAILASATAGTAGAASVVVRLPTASSVSSTDTRLVFNSPSSTQDVLLRNGGGTANIATVSPGQMATCHADAASNKWLVMVDPFSYGG